MSKTDDVMMKVGKGFSGIPSRENKHMMEDVPDPERKRKRRLTLDDLPEAKKSRRGRINLDE